MGNKRNGKSGRRGLPPHIVESIRRNRGLVHAIACEFIETRSFSLGQNDEPKDLRRLAGDCVAKKLRHLTDESLGRICSVGRGTLRDDDSPTCMAEVHDDPAWLARASKLSGRRLLEGIATTVVIAWMYDILLDRAEDAEQAADRAA